MTTEEMQKQIESMMPTPNHIVESIDKKLEEKREQIVQVMDYEKKYKDAMGMAEEIIRYYKEHNRSDENSIEDLEQIFTELKESEDERIRKDLLAFIKAPYVYDFIVHDRVDPWIAWIEKQGEPKQEWSDEDERAIGIIKIALKHPYDMEGKWDRKFALDWLKSLKDRVQPQPKQEWSEEDENMANDLIEGCILCISSEKSCHLVHTSKKIADWLKSLKDRMKGKED